MMNDRFRELLAARKPILFDGAMGTMLQEGALPPGAPPEGLNLSRPDAVAAVHRAYAEAGAMVVQSNTFGGNRIKLAAFGLADEAERINASAVRLAKAAVGDRVLVAGDIGPTGRFIAPLGDLAFDEAVGVFAEQAAALAEAGADLLVLETFSDVRELRAALIGARSACSLPLVASMTFEPSGRTLLGTPPEAAAITLEAAGASVVGANCGLGPAAMVAILRRMAGATALPLLYMPNAGLPRLERGRTLFSAGPDEVAAPATELLNLGVACLGGCCGTTPAHIARLAQETSRVTRLAPRGLADRHAVRLSSRRGFVLLGGNAPLRIIGERLNPTGRRALAQSLREGDFSRYREDARAQAAAGAHLLDVNVGAPGIDEVAAMALAVAAVQEGAPVPLVLDSPRPEVLEEGLRAADGKVLLNSVTGEADSLARVLPLARRYGAAVLGLTLDGRGIPPRAEDRLAIAERIVAAARRVGLGADDVVIDCLTLSAGAEQENVAETLRAVRLVREKLGVAVSLGVSNVSFGLPSREGINSAFLAMAAGSGLSAAIVNPFSAAMETAAACRVILNQDTGSREWIAGHSAAEALAKAAPADKPGMAAPPPGGAKATPATPEDQLALAVIDGDDRRAGELAEALLAAGTPPIEMGERVLIPAMTRVGELFARSEYFLPQVVASARAMKAAFVPVRERLRGLDLPSRGSILVATVEGDIHDIGKNMVVTLLENHGYAVTDLGKNVPAEALVKAALASRPDAIGLSALMTTTMGKMREAVAALRAAGVASPVAVGGAAVTGEFAAEIGADGFAPDATSAVALFARLVREPVRRSLGEGGSDGGG
jgi:5-methyltetrahydrofolate--homocysteine methyltransferase